MLRKLFVIFILSATILLPLLATAQEPPESIPQGCTLKYNLKDIGCLDAGNFCGEGSTCGPDGKWGICCMFNTMYTVTNWVFYIMTVVAVLMIVFGGFTYLTAAGDPGKAGKGKGILMYAMIGLAIALIAKIIPSLVRFVLGL